MKRLSRPRGRAIIDAMSGKRFLVVGDVMLDRFLWGNVSRISPEAPVPVVRIERETAVPGGAGNVVQNLAALGVRVDVAGVVGDDDAGRELTALLSRSGAGCEGMVRREGYPTTVKARIMARGQQLLRADWEDDAEPLPGDVLDQLASRVRALIGEVDAVIFSDYNKGTLDEALVSACLELAVSREIHLAADPKPNHFPLFRSTTTVITPNRHEAFHFLGETVPSSVDEIATGGRRILRRLDCRAVLITRGSDGMTLVEKGRRVFSTPAAAREVFEVTGAGDTVIAWLTAGLAAGADLREATVLANQAAGIVVGKVGTTPVGADEVAEIL